MFRVDGSPTTQLTKGIEKSISFSKKKGKDKRLVPEMIAKQRRKRAMHEGDNFTPIRSLIAFVTMTLSCEIFVSNGRLAGEDGVLQDAYHY